MSRDENVITTFTIMIYPVLISDAPYKSLRSV